MFRHFAIISYVKNVYFFCCNHKIVCDTKYNLVSHTKTENSTAVLKITQRIINGKETTIYKYPHHVRIGNGGDFVCGGSIIHEKAILTAAHCISDATTVRIGVDRYNEGVTNAINVKRTVIHPQYDSNTLSHDIAVILLAKNLSFGDKVHKIEMATAVGVIPQSATIVGWGCTYCIWFIPFWLCGLSPASEKLRSGELVLSKYQGHVLQSTSRVKSCPGDSGGPVITSDGNLIGVISHMDVFFLRNRPSYFISVPDHIDWIWRVIMKGY